MVKQLLLFKFKENIKPDEIMQFFTKYKELEALDCLHSVEYGKNSSTEGFDKGFTYGAIASFENKDDVDTFLEHPKHVELADKYLNPLLEDFILVEFENK